MNSVQQILRYNMAHLEQGLALLGTLSDAQYSHAETPVYRSGAGEHMRHVLEHYSCFLEGVRKQRIDYDARKRELLLSSHRDSAAARFREIIAELEDFVPEDAPVDVKMASTDSSDEESPWSSSSIKRELQYLLAHTIHHYALIAMILRLQGIEPVDGFGVAPSTLRHRRETAQSS